jgi:hypothetical protein
MKILTSFVTGSAVSPNPGGSTPSLSHSQFLLQNSDELGSDDDDDDDQFDYRNGQLTDSSNSTTVVDAVPSTAAADGMKPKRKYVYSAAARERRNARRRRCSILPRSMKRDIRQEYVQILMHALNLFDAAYLFGCMQTFCTPDCKLVNFLPAIQLYGASPVVQLQDHQLITQFWLMNGRFIPDLVCRSTRPQLRLNIEENHRPATLCGEQAGDVLTSRISATIRFQGTQVFVSPATSAERQIMELITRRGERLISNLDGFQFEHPEFNRLLSEFGVDWLAFKTQNLPTPLSAPVHLLFDANMTLSINENNFITKMEFIGKDVTEEKTALWR